MSNFTCRHTFASLPRTERGTPLVLGQDPKGKTFLYCQGNSVIIRDLEHPEIADVYTQHSCPVSVAKYSPSGFYIASADKSGKVRIWDTVNKEHILKNEYQPISGPIKDLAWSQDNQRIVVVGEGREKFGHVFLADTGTSNGDITGQTRPVNSCDIKPSRPFRIITGSEDNTSAIYEGPPFKFKGTKSEHSRYVQTVRYSPDGNFWASGGFDGKIFLYDGKESTLIGEFVEDGKSNAHGGGVYAVAWSPDGKQLLSASGDKTCRIWDVATRKLVTEFVMGTTVDDQQLGCLWSGDYLISISLSGHINYLDPKDPSKPKRILEGHNKPITCVEKTEKGIITSGSDGRIVKWDVETGNCKRISGKGHESQVNSVYAVGEDGDVSSLGIDDTVRRIRDGEFVTGVEIKLGGQPRAGCHVGDSEVVVTVNGSIVFIENGRKIWEENVEYEPTSVSFNSGNGHLAVGDSTSKVRIYQTDPETHALNDVVREIVLSGVVMDLSYSPDGKYLVTADGNRKVTLYDTTSNYERANNKEWGFHTAKVNCVAWSPDSKHVVSGGLDCSVIVWSVENPSKHYALLSAHIQSQITGVKWLDNQTFVSTGQDANVKIWNISY